MTCLPRAFAVTFALLLAAPLASAQEAGFAELLDLGDGARAHWPELAMLVKDAREIAAGDTSLEVKTVRKHRYGWGGASYTKAKADRLALGQALQALVDLELAAAARNAFDDANRYRHGHDALRAWINRGIELRFSREDEPFRAPELETALRVGRSYPALVADLPRTSTVTYGIVPAAVALVLELAKEARRQEPTGQGPLAAGFKDTAKAADRVWSQLLDVRRDAAALESARAVAAVSDRDARRASRDRVDAAALVRERALAVERAARLEVSLSERLSSSNPVLAMELGPAQVAGAAAGRARLEHADAAGVLARRARGPYFYLIFIDGLRPDVIAEAVARRDARGRTRLPWFAKHLETGASFSNAFGVFPSVTTANTVALTTGAMPERNGVPSNAVFDRSSRTWTRFLGARTSRKVDDDVPSRFLHEYFPEDDRFTPLMPVQRGVSSSVFKFPHVLGGLFSLGWPDGLFFNATRRELSKGRGGRGGGAKLPARCMTLYLGWFDHVSHDEPLGERSEAAFEQLLKYDEQLTKIEADRERLGIADKTYTILFSDHGMISSPDGQGSRKIAMNDVLSAWGLPINKGAVDNGNGPHTIPETADDLRSRERRGARNGRSRPSRETLPGTVADVAGNGTLGLYFRHRSWHGTWGKRNLVADLRAYELNTEAQPVDLLDRLVRIDGVQHVLAREGEHAARVAGRSGEAIVTWQPGPDGMASTGRFSYRVESGSDPLDMGALADGVFRDVAEWLALTADYTFPGAPYQIAQAFAANQDLDVTLCAQVGRNFTAGDHHLHSDHGFLRRESIRLTMIVAGPDVVPGDVSTPIRSVDLVPTVLDLAGLESRPGEVDGRSLVPLLSRPNDPPSDQQHGLIETLQGQ
jgi:arylsulfatase A-like enzyme